jgi:probable HAF family extracellular repeat protein
LMDLGTLGGRTTSAWGINDSGQIVGTSATASGAQHAFLYSDSTLTDLGTFGGTESGACDINSSGQVVGYSLPHTGPASAVLYSDSTVTYLGTLEGSWWSAARAINDSGQIAGEFGTVSAAQHGFLYSDSTMIDLGTLVGGGDLVYTTDINSSGQVIGFAATTHSASIRYHAFLYSGSMMTDLGTLGGTESFALGINDNGQVVGRASVGDHYDTRHAFLYSGSTMTDLNSLIAPDSGLVLESANAINACGQIAGLGSRNGVLHAVLLTPVPEPGAWAMTLGGLVFFNLLAVLIRRRSTHGLVWKG